MFTKPFEKSVDRQVEHEGQGADSKSSLTRISHISPSSTYGRVPLARGWGGAFTRGLARDEVEKRQQFCLGRSFFASIGNMTIAHAHSNFLGAPVSRKTCSASKSRVGVLSISAVCKYVLASLARHEGVWLYSQIDATRSWH